MARCYRCKADLTAPATMHPCPHCGTQNAIPSGQQPAQCACGSCQRVMHAAGVVDAQPLTTPAGTATGNHIAARVIVGIFGVLLLLGGIGVWKVANFFTADTDTAPTPDLGAHVEFTGAQFAITNLDDDAWTDITCTVNSHGWNGEGYTYRLPQLAAGKTYTVGALRFATASGTRFDPFTMKVNKFDLRATCNGEVRFWYGTFNEE